MRDDTIAFDELAEFGELLVAGGGVQPNHEADGEEAHGDFATDAQSAAEIEVTLGFDRAGPKRDVHGCGDGAGCCSGTPDERFEQHFGGAGK